MDDLAGLQKAASRAEQAFSEREQHAAGSGFDYRELCGATSEVARLLQCYRAGKLDPGADTGEFIEGAILRQAELLAQVENHFLRWLADEQARFNACMAWVHAANAHAAALARQGGDAVEQSLADQLQAGRAAAPVH